MYATLIIKNYGEYYGKVNGYNFAVLVEMAEKNGMEYTIVYDED